MMACKGAPPRPFARPPPVPDGRSAARPRSAKARPPAMSPFPKYSLSRRRRRLPGLTHDFSCRRCCAERSDLVQDMTDAGVFQDESHPVHTRNHVSRHDPEKTASAHRPGRDDPVRLACGRDHRSLGFVDPFRDDGLTSLKRPAFTMSVPRGTTARHVAKTRGPGFSRDASMQGLCPLS